MLWLDNIMYKQKQTALHTMVCEFYISTIMSLISNQMKLVNQQENSRPTVWMRTVQEEI